MASLHVFDYLANPKEFPAAAITVFWGTESFLRQLAVAELRAELNGGDQDAPYATFDGEKVEWRDVVDELATVSLFGSRGKRLVVVEDADTFVTQYRDKLEDYVARPKANSILVLLPQTWLATTRLYKAIDQSRLQVECRPPERTYGKTKAIDEARIRKWLIAWARTRHQVNLQELAAEVLLELTGPNFGLLEQNLAKLALFVGKDGKLTAEMVQDVVGGWKAKTTWDLVNAAADGDAGEALLQFDRLLQAGANPLELMGAIAWSMRRFATATRLYERSERAGQRISLRDALLKSGFRAFPADALPRAEKQMIQLGRDRAGRMFRAVLDLDLALKGTHSAPDRARLALEEFFVRLAKQK